MDALVALIEDLEKAKGKGASEAQLKVAWGHQRRAQFYVDFVESENSNGFHAPPGGDPDPGRSHRLGPKGPDRPQAPPLTGDPLPG